MKLKDIAELLAGEIAGDPETEVTGVSGIGDAKEGDITFISSTKYMRKLRETKASCVIVKEFITDLKTPQIKVSDPYMAFVRLLEYFYVKPPKRVGVSELAFVSSSATLREDVSVYPFAFISDSASIGRRCVIHSGVFIGEGVIIGEDSIIYPNAVLREGVRVGKRVIIHPGVVIGSDGFGFIFRDGLHHKIPQVGGVIVEDDVEIGANSTIDRATTGNTVIGRGTKIDNLVQVGHNVKIGEGTIIVAQVGIGGSTEIGRFTTIGGQAGISDHAIIEEGTMIGAQSGVMGNLPKGAYSGTPQIPHTTWLKASALFSRLPELSKRIKILEEKLNEIQRRFKDD